MGTLAAIYRHPVKSLGADALSAVTLTEGRPLPWDRVWAIAHDHSEFNPTEPDWVASRNFVVQSFNPKLAQITCRFDEATGDLTLAHPALGTLRTSPGEDSASLTEWVAPLAEPTSPPPYRLAHVPGRALHDFADTDISIGNLASLRALEDMVGHPLAHIRFRMNLWVDGFAPWEELDWAERELSIGSARLSGIGRVKRCNATNADPATGTRNTEIPRLLHGRFGHMDFGIYAKVTGGGEIAQGDQVAI